MSLFISPRALLFKARGVSPLLGGFSISRGDGTRAHRSVAILDDMKEATRQKSGGRPDARAWAGLVLAVLGVSGTSTYMKLAGTDPLVTAFWRLALSTLLLLPLQIWRRCNTLKGNGTVPKCNSLDVWVPHNLSAHGELTCCNVITCIRSVLRYTVGTLNGGGTNAGRWQLSQRLCV